MGGKAHTHTHPSTITNGSQFEIYVVRNDYSIWDRFSRIHTRLMIDMHWVIGD